MIQRKGILRIDLQDIGGTKMNTWDRHYTIKKLSKRGLGRKGLGKIGSIKKEAVRRIHSNKARALSKLCHLNSVQEKTLRNPSSMVLHGQNALKSKHALTQRS